jgi:hypothetical protein
MTLPESGAEVVSGKGVVIEKKVVNGLSAVGRLFQSDEGGCRRTPARKLTSEIFRTESSLL